MNIVEDITEILAAAKTLLEIKDNDKDDILSLIINDTIDAVLAYCHIKVLPRQLEGFIPHMAAARFTKNNQGGVRSVTEGERRVDYGEADTDFLALYGERLRPFVSRQAWLPSDLEEKDNA